MISKKFNQLQEAIAYEKQIAEQLNQLYQILKQTQEQDKRIIMSQISSLKSFLKKMNNLVKKTLEDINLAKPLKQEKQIPEKKEPKPKKIKAKPVSKDLEKLLKENKDILKRLRKKEKKTIKKKQRKPGLYTKLANKILSKTSLSILDKPFFNTLKRDLVKANLLMLPASYISVLLFTTLLSVFVSIFAVFFLLFFNINLTWPIISMVEEAYATRFLKVFWVFLAIPVLTFIALYVYPGLEKKSNENKIDQELPFSVIHMAAISGSMVEPSKIFSIIISTGEYEYLGKEFTKLMNHVNIYGYDIVTALKISARNTASKKLAELFNGLATTISSGGNLPEFFEKRSQSLLFDYRIEREKYTKSAETFMDIYISVVIAAPMILMLLLMMIRISGIGISLSTGMITLIMILGVSMINILFLTFLHLKQPSG